MKDALHRLNGESVPTPGMLEHLKITPTLGPKAKIVTNHHMLDADRSNKILLNELLGGAFGQAAIEAQCKQLVDAAGRNSFPLIASTTYSCRNRARCVRKVLFGMRPKGHKAREHLILMRARRNGCEQGAMATMHAIEISDGQGGCWRGLFAALGRPTNDLHKRPL
jgi:hypothetical protein